MLGIPPIINSQILIQNIHELKVTLYRDELKVTVYGDGLKVTVHKAKLIEEYKLYSA